ncbi:hypothetical protein [Azotobacter beijerinckii]|uniref:hypothetical protein n=1 Tax=Azotobacter beijerinckii TaxID=170623 RepID=UPI002955C283|nr:hypothetical protein [Azotobacter beijerinckii]MDV7210115.1 hypothetical protein [Azotobacter beijerinckii]
MRTLEKSLIAADEARREAAQDTAVRLRGKARQHTVAEIARLERELAEPKGGNAVIDLPISEQYLEQLQNDCAMSNIDLSRCHMSTAPNGRFQVTHDRPLVDISGFALGLPNGLSVVGGKREVECWMHFMALKVQRAERQKLRLGRMHEWDPARLFRQPVDEEELSRFLAEQRD